MTSAAAYKQHVRPIKGGTLYTFTDPIAPGYAGEAKHNYRKGFFSRFVTPENPNPAWDVEDNAASAIARVNKLMSAVILERRRDEHMRSEAVRRYPYPCPTCGAVKGQKCRTARGAVASRPHAARPQPFNN